eukprot:CAMPEP_0117427358 /NCGR_PEP_ID=MMETSP0758-20121206/7227_1 /TAXON_ID=63605 /ORGANISM="Percolomonas cosmopolitus, Strain AE-1 (ATCC 50343)" /LENGTH=273 /DNA_ID=CAMNT_0005212957 /DNA_START=406 /DNA_END=1224 /DNA_ORIENTATION=+
MPEPIQEDIEDKSNEVDLKILRRRRKRSHLRRSKKEEVKKDGPVKFELVPTRTLLDRTQNISDKVKSFFTDDIQPKKPQPLTLKNISKGGYRAKDFSQEDSLSFPIIPLKTEILIPMKIDGQTFVNQDSAQKKKMLLAEGYTICRSSITFAERLFYVKMVEKPIHFQITMNEYISRMAIMVIPLNLRETQPGICFTINSNNSITNRNIFDSTIENIVHQKRRGLSNSDVIKYHAEIMDSTFAYCTTLQIKRPSGVAYEIHPLFIECEGTEFGA